MMTDHSADDDELELEPIDPAILKAQQERTKQKSRKAEDAIDVNQGFDDQTPEDPVDLEQLKKFRFRTQHLLSLTAVLAVTMTIFNRLGGCMGILVSGIVALGAGWWFVLREEKLRFERVVAQREEQQKRLAMRRAVEDGKPVPEFYTESFDAAYDGETEVEEIKTTQEEFKLPFSPKEILSVIGGAIVALGCMWFIGPNIATLLFGIVAIVGLVAQALNVKMPPIVAFAWWVFLVLYVLVSLSGGFTLPPTPVLE